MTTTAKIASPLSRKAMLASVNISQWTARKLDRKITAEVNEAHNASTDAGRYNKLLIEAERLTKIGKLVTEARILHYSLTRPWADEGPRILPNALYSKFTDEFRRLKREFNEAADEFCAGYPQFVEERKAKLNGMFREADYPSAKEIRSKFRFEIRMLPFPDAEDFRADIDADTLADLKREYAESSSDVLSNAMQHTINQIVKLVGHMAEKLHQYKNGDAKPSGDTKTTRNFFMDSLVENLRDLVELLPAFNLTDDPNLTAITKRIKQELCAEDAQVLRDNDDVRESVAKSADEIVAEVGKFFA